MDQNSPSGIGKTARMSEWIRRDGIGDEFIDPKGDDQR